ncbi:YHS domain-containing protein [Pseudomonas alkylphenolica]|uniref:YHS domain-containing protein n=1 Tax=Pseudomonas alkylphenolica TaxID=237609 RepID=UPI000949B6C9
MHGNEDTHSSPGTEISSGEVKGPVCGMTVKSDSAHQLLQYAGESHRFCSEKCLSKFKAAPERYGALCRRRRTASRRLQVKAGTPARCAPRYVSSVVPWLHAELGRAVDCQPGGALGGLAILRARCARCSSLAPGSMGAIPGSRSARLAR